MDEMQQDTLDQMTVVAMNDGLADVKKATGASLKWLLEMEHWTVARVHRMLLRQALIKQQELRERAEADLAKERELFSEKMLLAIGESMEAVERKRKLLTLIKTLAKDLKEARAAAGHDMVPGRLRQQLDLRDRQYRNLTKSYNEMVTERDRARTLVGELQDERKVLSNTVMHLSQEKEDLEAELATIEASAIPAAFQSTGAVSIFDERARQVRDEGFTAAHDAVYTKGELARAALCYLSYYVSRYFFPIGTVTSALDFIAATWPWAQSRWKLSEDRRNLVKAGALIAAEIDRMDRVR